MTRNRQPILHATESDHPGTPFAYHWFAFYQGWREGRDLKQHHLRDGAAFRELSVALDDRGGRYHELFRNGPATPETHKRNAQIIAALAEENQHPLVEEVLAYRPVDLSFLEPRHLLVVATRIPMDDFLQPDKVRVEPGFTSLEQNIIRSCRPYLPCCARSRVVLAGPLAALLEPEFADRADIRFKSYKDARYTQLCTARPGARAHRPRPGPCRTAAYLLQLPAVPALNGADLLVMWGMGGTQTLAFAHLLRTDLSYLLDRYGFSMVEMVEPESPEPAAPSEPGPSMLLDFVHDWEVRVLLESVLLDASGQKVCAPMPVRRGRAPALRVGATARAPLRGEIRDGSKTNRV